MFFVLLPLMGLLLNYSEGLLSPSQTMKKATHPRLLMKTMKKSKSSQDFPSKSIPTLATSSIPSPARTPWWITVGMTILIITSWVDLHKHEHFPATSVESTDHGSEEVLHHKDIWRETQLRYLGYTNEVGESFGVLFPRYVRPSYGVAFTYVACDAADKTMAAIQDGKIPTEVLRIGSDALLWQTLASVLIPGKVINIAANEAMNSLNSSFVSDTLPPPVKRWAPTAIGLILIPLIIHPIDHIVDILMDNSIRLWWTAM